MPLPVLLDRLVSGQRREIDEIGYRGAHLDDLRRLLQPHQQRANALAAAQLLQQLGRDVGAVFFRETGVCETGGTIVNDASA